MDRALILGGSEGIGIGIGIALAQKLAAAGLDLTLVARSAPVLEEAAQAIRQGHAVDVETLTLDLTGADVQARAAQIIAAHEYGLVIYNAVADHTDSGHWLMEEQPVATSNAIIAFLDKI